MAVLSFPHFAEEDIGGEWVKLQQHSTVNVLSVVLFDVIVVNSFSLWITDATKHTLY